MLRVSYAPWLGIAGHWQKACAAEPPMTSTMLTSLCRHLEGHHCCIEQARRGRRVDIVRPVHCGRHQQAHHRLSAGKQGWRWALPVVGTPRLASGCRRQRSPCGGCMAPPYMPTGAAPLAAT